MTSGVQEQQGTERVGVYVSVPFCRHKCSFCNFASGVGSSEALKRYVDSLCDEIRSAEAIAQAAGGILLRAVDTVYLGGGTPSLLLPSQLEQIFAALRCTFGIDKEAEITLEAAPGQIADDVLASAVMCGVNRVSLGVQSFVDRECSAVGRTHTSEDCLREFGRLRQAGVASVGADLIAGLPYQTEASWMESLVRARHADLDHLSVYMLEVDEESRLGREILLGGQKFHAGHVVSDELITRLYEEACEVLPAAGFKQYEISNFARPGSSSRHNRKYWERSPYIGFGVDAHSMLQTNDGRAVRFANPAKLGDYAGSASLRAPAVVSDREAFEETVFLALRLLDGLQDARLTCFPKEWCTGLHRAAAEMADGGLMERDEDSWRLTLRGRLLSGEVFGELLAGTPV